MDRREALGLFGAIGAGAVIAGENRLAADHGHARPGGDKFMAPVSGIHAHFCGIHIAKNNPKFQIVAQHYCGPRGDEMHQCLLFDSLETNAKLLGVEYIVSDRLYQQLALQEKAFWHPHTYEVLAGGLIAPGMKSEDEMKFMRGLINTWGKTWHTWPDPTTEVPIGEPLLMWSLTGDEQDDKEVFAARDKQFGMSTAKVREKRIEAFGLEVPQVPPPKSMDAIGRQWTATGEDKPTPRKK